MAFHPVFVIGDVIWTCKIIFSHPFSASLLRRFFHSRRWNYFRFHPEKSPTNMSHNKLWLVKKSIVNYPQAVVMVASHNMHFHIVVCALCNYIRRLLTLEKTFYALLPFLLSSQKRKHIAIVVSAASRYATFLHIFVKLILKNLNCVFLPSN